MSVILLASGEHEIVASVARCLGEVGKNVIIIGVDKCKGSLLSANCLELYEVPPGYFNKDCNALVKLINEVAGRGHCEVIIPISVPAACFLSNNRQFITSLITIVHLSEAHLILKLNNKWELYCYLKELNLPVPRTILLENSEQAAMQTIGFPALTKPLDEGGGDGIQYYWHENDYKNAPPSQFPVIMQEYIPGWDMGVSLYCIEGEVRAVTIQRVEAGNFTFINKEEALNICRKIIATEKYSGLANFDLRYDEREGIIKCLECNPRCWQTIHYSALAGLNFPLLAYDIVKDGYSSVPNAVMPQWIPNPRSIWFRNPRRALSQWKSVGQAMREYIGYYRDNFAYETYRTLSYHNPNIAAKWFNFVLWFNKYFRDKYKLNQNCDFGS